MSADEPGTARNDDALAGQVFQRRLDGECLNSADHRTNLYGGDGGVRYLLECTETVSRPRSGRLADGGRPGPGASATNGRPDRGRPRP